jgi:hypothetical protein
MANMVKLFGWLELESQLPYHEVRGDPLLRPTAVSFGCRSCCAVVSVLSIWYSKRFTMCGYNFTDYICKKIQDKIDWSS